MIKPRQADIKIWMIRHKKRLLQASGALLFLVVVQFLYPESRMIPFASVDNIAVGGWQKSDATRELDARYSSETIGIYFGKAEKPYTSPKPADFGLKVSNQPRIDDVRYPWYLRIVPTSLLWAHLVVKPTSEPQFSVASNTAKAYISRELGQSCSVAPKNASFKSENGKLVLIPAEDGGSCELPTVLKALTEAQVYLTRKSRINVPVKVIEPAITNETAQKVVASLNGALSKGVTIMASATSHVVPAGEVINWLDPVEKGAILEYEFNAERASGYLNQHIAPQVAVKPGVSKVTTHDFIETAREDGAPGKTLDIAGTLAQLKVSIASQRQELAAVTKSISPTVEYTRTYSGTDTGLTALLKHYAESHAGTFGISLIELSDKRRRAVYQDDKQFTTASTYKLFVAYSALKRVEEGQWRWTDHVQGGRNLEKCFDDMIVRSDNACAEAMLQKIGFKAATSEIQALGLKNTTFLKGDTPLTTAGDLSMFNAILQSGQMLSQQSSRDKLLNAMKRNIYRQGIPAGANGQVADKVGFLNGLFHDAAIVYSPTGPYVLTIMSEGSNWATIADLTKQIESLRSR